MANQPSCCCEEGTSFWCLSVEHITGEGLADQMKKQAHFCQHKLLKINRNIEKPPQSQIMLTLAKLCMQMTLSFMDLCPQTTIRLSVIPPELLQAETLPLSRTFEV